MANDPHGTMHQRSLGLFNGATLFHSMPDATKPTSMTGLQQLLMTETVRELKSSQPSAIKAASPTTGSLKKPEESLLRPPYNLVVIVPIAV